MSRGLAVFESSPTQIIFTSMDLNKLRDNFINECLTKGPNCMMAYHNRAPNDIILANQWDLFIRDVNFCYSIITSNNITQVSCMSVFIFRSTVLFTIRIKMRSSTNTPCVYKLIKHVKWIISYLLNITYLKSNLQNGEYGSRVFRGSNQPLHQ